MEDKKKLKRKTTSRAKNPKKDQNTIMENIRRIPRPTGVSLLSREYRRTNDTTTLSNLQNKIIGEYIHGGFKVCGNVVNIQGLALYLGMGIGDLMKKVHQQIQMVSGLADGKRLEEMASALIFTSFSNSLQARHIALAQTELLLRAQGDTYVPFVSSTVNHSITNLMAADKSMMQLYSTLKGNNGNQINIHNNASLVQNNQYLTTDQAVKIITDKGHTGLLRRPEMKEQIYLANQIESQPEVIATKQANFLEDRIPTLKTQTTPSITHIDRNELDGDILDGDDL